MAKLNWRDRTAPRFPKISGPKHIGAGSLLITDSYHPDGKMFIIRSHSNPHTAWPILEQAMLAINELSEESKSKPSINDFVFWANQRHQAEGITESEIKYRYRGKYPAWIVAADLKHHVQFFGSQFDEYLYHVDLNSGKIRWIR